MSRVAATPESKMTTSVEDPPPEPPPVLTREAIKQNPDLLVDVYRTGNFGVYLGRILIHKYKGWSVANLVLAALFALLTVAAEGLLYHGLPQEWVRMSASVAFEYQTSMN